MPSMLLTNIKYNKAGVENFLWNMTRVLGFSRYGEYMGEEAESAEARGATRTLEVGPGLAAPRGGVAPPGLHRPRLFAHIFSVSGKP